MASFPGARVVVLLCFLVHLVFSVDWIAIQALSVSVIFFFLLVFLNSFFFLIFFIIYNTQLGFIFSNGHVPWYVTTIVGLFFIIYILSVGP